MAARTILVLSSLIAIAMAAPPAFAFDSDASPQGNPTGGSGNSATSPAKPHHHHHHHAKKHHKPQPGDPQHGGSSTSPG